MSRSTITFRGAAARRAFEAITGHKIPRPEDLLKQVKAFNAANAVGTPVNVGKDDGTVLETTTRSEAWLMSGHSAMILVEGISGGYLLERVTPRVATPAGGGS